MLDVALALALALWAQPNPTLDALAHHSLARAHKSIVTHSHTATATCRWALQNSSLCSVSVHLVALSSPSLFPLPVPIFQSSSSFPFLPLLRLLVLALSILSSLPSLNPLSSPSKPPSTKPFLLTGEPLESRVRPVQPPLLFSATPNGFPPQPSSGNFGPGPTSVFDGLWVTTPCGQLDCHNFPPHHRRQATDYIGTLFRPYHSTSPSPRHPSKQTPLPSGCDFGGQIRGCLSSNERRAQSTTRLRVTGPVRAFRASGCVANLVLHHDSHPSAALRLKSASQHLFFSLFACSPSNNKRDTASLSRP